jgi:hypothetical protein
LRKSKRDRFSKKYQRFISDLWFFTGLNGFRNGFFRERFLELFIIYLSPQVTSVSFGLEKFMAEEERILIVNDEPNGFVGNAAYL